ncbi:hypothetical protein VTK26DRAFT_9377 [Humicola hyalothermophila]
MVGEGTLFCSLLPTEDRVTCEQVDALGPLPREWWERWKARSKYFTETGQPVPGREARSLQDCYDWSIHNPRLERDMALPDAEERDAFLDMIRQMLALRPGDRPSAQQVLEMEWDESLGAAGMRQDTGRDGNRDVVTSLAIKVVDQFALCTVYAVRSTEVCVRRAV